MSTREDRIKGVLLGQAAGDALGSGYEFRKPPVAGKAVFKRGTFGHPAGSWTDDTEQAITVAQAKSDPIKVAAGLLGWFRGEPQDVGASTAQVLNRAREPEELAAVSRAFADWQAAMPRPSHWDPGGANGSLMRTGPVCLPYLGDRDRIAEAAREISDLTHADPYCGDACVIWSLAIERAVQTGEFDAGDLFDSVFILPEERRRFWHTVIAVAELDEPSGDLSANGSAVGAFKAALWAVAHADGLEDGLQKAVAIGGDTDTVAAIAGALLGAIYGASAVSVKWRKRLHGWPGLDADQLESLAFEAAGGAR